MTKQHPIPDAVLTKKHVAILGMTGSGKTSTAKLAVEQVVPTGARVCIIDPVKSDWWGLTSSADGKRPGLPFQILGGPHGHVPLHDGAGAAIGELVATGALPLSIIDMADFKAGGPNRFFNAFADTLMRKMRGVLHLVIEEAHEFAPKERSGVGEENMSVYYAKKLATAGRSKGIRLIVCSQRVQALHNAVLGSCQTLIVHRFTAPADQAPVLTWLKGNVKDKAQRLTIENSLQDLQDGQGWICSTGSPLALVQFPRIQTFDNSATPEGDDEQGHVVTARVDVGRLREVIGSAVAEAEASDPKMLRKRIVDLEQQLASSNRKAETDSAYKSGYDTGRMHGYGAGQQAAFGQFTALRDAAIVAFRKQQEGIAKLVTSLPYPLEELPKWRETPATAGSPPRAGAPAVPSEAPSAPRQVTPRALTNGHAPPSPPNSDDPPSVRKILDVIHRAYPVSLSFDAAARRAAISSASSAYRKYRVLVHGSVEVEQVDGKYRSRPEFAGGSPMTSETSLAQWIQKLPPSYGKMLQAIHEQGPADKERIAELAGVSPTSSGLGSGLRELQRLQLIAERDGRYDVEEGLR